MLMMEEITGWADFGQLAEAWAERPGTFLLDSGGAPTELARWSFLGSRPFARMLAAGRQIEITETGQTRHLEGDPFEELQRLLRRFQCDRQSAFPFAGGAVGYWGYDLALHLERLPRQAKDDTGLPDLVVGFYDGIIVHDRGSRRTYATALGILAPAEHVLQSLLADCRASLPPPPVCQAGAGPAPALTAALSKADYLERIKRIRDYIQAGDVYQVNFTQRFAGVLPCAPWELWRRLRQLNPAPFAAWLNHPEVQLVSASPERFLRLAGRRVSTRPIKGTRPRGTTPEQDLARRQELAESEKDRAELLMIVDLERNDLGRVAVPGTVRVPELFAIETHPTVFHQVAEVTAELEPGLDVIDLLRASFPGGSITGAPKIRAMEIIDELEPCRRGPYTGALGWIGFDGDADLNIIIRTFACRHGHVWFQAGGGIVWDSDPEQEYAEMLDKAQALFRALGCPGPEA
jgi:para-aminobenzoate synthetase component 1